MPQATKATPSFSLSPASLSTPFTSIAYFSFAPYRGSIADCPPVTLLSLLFYDKLDVFFFLI